MAQGKPLDLTQIAGLLKADADAPRRGVKRDPTEERTVANWFKQNHNLSQLCQNPDCSDPRTTVHSCSHSSKYHEPDCLGNCEEIFDRGRTTTVKVKGDLFVCRYCFLAGVVGEPPNEQ